MRLFRNRRRRTSSPSQTRPPPGPRTRTSGNLSRSATAQPYASSPSQSSPADFADARQRWSEIANHRRCGLSLASDELDNAAASIDSICLDQGVRHGCTPAHLFNSYSTSVINPSATSDSGTSSVPSAHPSPSSYPPTRSVFQPAETTPTSSPNLGRQYYPEVAGSPGPRFNFDFAELTALKRKFNQLDAEGKGFLSRSQFYELFSTFLEASAHDPHHTPMFNFAYSLFQSAGDRLNLREFVTGMSVLTRGSEEDRLRYLFMMYDTDGSGHLTQDEIKQVFRVMGSYAASHDYTASDSLDSQSLSSLRRINPAMLDELVRKAVREYDLDGDGQIGFEDFVKWCGREPVVKTWMDMLSYDTARGVARLRGQSERELIARELETLGIMESDILYDINLHNQPRFNSALPSNTSILPPNVSSQQNALPHATQQSNSSNEYDGHGRRQATTSQAVDASESGSGVYTPGTSHNDLDRRSRSMTETAIGSFGIDFRTLTFEKQIGSGSFAVVWKCKWLDSPVAVKVFKSGPRLVVNSDGTPSTIPTSNVTSSSNNCDQGFVENGESFEPEYDSIMNARNAGVNQSLYGEEVGTEFSTNRVRFLQEVSLLTSIRHPNLLLYMGACVDPNYPLCIVSELIDGGSLFELLHGREKVKLTLRQKLMLTQDIARGMLYLHGRDPIVLHRDLKSANILVELQSDSTFKGTIIDFGLSKFDSTQASIVPGRGRGLTGSLVTMAPEVMHEQEYEPRSDVYSYAIVCWEIWCGRIPFGKLSGPTQLMMKVAVQGARPEFEREDAVPVAIQNLIRACWDQDIQKRPDFLMVAKTLRGIRHELNLDDDDD